MTGQVQNPADHRNSYGPRGDTWSLVLSVLHDIGVPETVALTGYSRSAVYAVLRDATPRPEHARTYQHIAATFARQRLQRWQLEAADADVAAITRYIAERQRRGDDVKRCRWCGEPTPSNRRRDARFCSDRCRRAAARASHVA